MPTLLTPDGTREGGVRSRWKNGIITTEEDWSFLVQADSLTQNRQEIIFGTAGLPVLGTVFNNMMTVGKDASRTAEHGLVWRVTVTLSNEVDGDDQNQQQGDPTTWIPVRQMLYERIEEVMTKDASGTVIANSAGQPFDTGIVQARYMPAWEFWQFDPISLTDEQMLAYAEVCNSTLWKTKAAKTWLCKIIDSTVGFYYGYRCRVTQFRVVYNWKKWTTKRLDVGTVYKSGSNILPYLDDQGNQYLGPLNGSGGKVSAGSPPAELEFDRFPTVDFATFLRV